MLKSFIYRYLISAYSFLNSLAILIRKFYKCVIIFTYIILRKGARSHLPN